MHIKGLQEVSAQSVAAVKPGSLRVNLSENGSRSRDSGANAGDVFLKLQTTTEFSLHTSSLFYRNGAEMRDMLMRERTRDGGRRAQGHAGSHHFLLLREQVPPPADVPSNKQQRFVYIRLLQTLEASCETQSPPMTARCLVAEALITEPSLARARLSLSRHAGLLTMNPPHNAAIKYITFICKWEAGDTSLPAGIKI